MLEVLLPAVFVFAFGAAVGSFLNVVVYRLPAGLSLLHPPSRCPCCQHRLRPYDNVPVLGWLWLRGRCRYCRAPIAIRYPLVEGLTGLLFLSLYGRFGWTVETWGYWLFVSLLLVLALIDLDTMTLPSRPMVIGVVSGWLFHGALAAQAVPTFASVGPALMGSLFASVLGLWLLSLIRILGSAALNQAAMGGADSKLAAMLGAWLGWSGLLLSLFLAALLGSLIGGSALLLQRLNRKQPIPFGPFLVTGAAITLFYGPALIQGYLSLFFPSGFPSGS
ncbi:MAG: prepilin peptidase [Leptolyngbya sp. SIO4C1]|nr:prepilin peptidase [Leptolyngbya sp. SIO4C1]